MLISVLNNRFVRPALFSFFLVLPGARGFRMEAGNESGLPADHVPVTGTKPLVNLVVIQGESNAAGLGLNVQASDKERGPRSNVQIINNNTLKFENLQLGVNNNIQQNLPDQTTHGFENGLADATDARLLSQPTYLVKAGFSGSKIGDWLSPAVNWGSLISRMDAAVRYLNDHHIPFRITVWQSIGINDYNAGTKAAAFQQEMIRFRTEFRNRYGQKIPFLMTHFFPAHPYNPVIDAVAASDPQGISKAIDITGATYRQQNIHWDYEGLKLIAGRMANITSIKHTSK